MTAAKVQLKIQREKKRKSDLLPLFIVVLAAAIFLIIAILRDQNAQFAQEKMSFKTSPPMAAAPPSPPPLVEHEETIRAGETIGGILARYRFSPAEVQRLYDQTKPVFDLRRLKAGQKLRLYAGPDDGIVSLEYDADEIHYLTVRKRGDGFEAALQAHPVDTELAMIFGTIEDNPISAFNQLGEEDSLALSFSDLFAWDVDFYIDLRQGDTFKVIFEKKYLLGKFIGYGGILAAELTNQSQVHQAFLYLPPDTGKPGYYDADGKSVEKEFRKSPIQWARITSRFSRSRLHPIHQVYRAHYGVDYAAPVGTPIQTTADGVVTFAGWNGGSGRMVRIRHRNSYETMYLHLRSFAPGIRERVRIKSGDIIGYVGSSGDSTGPHLDYRITQGGSYLNPLSARFNPVEPLKEEFLADYRQSIEKYKLIFQNPLVLVGPGLF